MTYRIRLLDGQITLPRRIRQLARLENGTPLDVTFRQGKIVLAALAAPEPQAPTEEIIEQDRAEFLQELRSAATRALKKFWDESERNDTKKKDRCQPAR